MNQIFESLDLSEEVKSDLQEAFDAAVLVEALELAKSKEEAYEEYMYTQLQESRAELEEKLDEYLDRIVEEFVTENTFAIEEAVNKETYESIVEGFGAVLVSAGVDIARIAKAKEVTESTVDVSSDTVDALMEEVLELKAKNAELLKTGLVKESMENMTEMQKDKFLRLATVLDFNAKSPELFINKLDTIAEAVISQKDRKEEMVVESVRDSSKYVSNARHLY